MYTAFPVTSAIAGVQPENVYVYLSVGAFVGSVGFTMSFAEVPYSYSVAALSTVVPSSSTNLILYFFFAELYFAVYVTSPVTGPKAGSQPANVYVSDTVAALVGSFGFSISATAVPYTYSFSSLSTVVPSSSTNLTLYFWAVELNWAVYVALPLTSVIAGLQVLLKVYDSPWVAFLVGVFPL